MLNSSCILMLAYLGRERVNNLSLTLFADAEDEDQQKFKEKMSHVKTQEITGELLVSAFS